MSTLPAEPIPFPVPRRPRLRKLRLLAVLIPLAVLGVISFVFGMMMAVASDVGSLENARAFQTARQSVITDEHGQPLGILTSAENRVIIPLGSVSLAMRNAIVAVEDKRFWTNSGVDIKGIARAFVADLVSGHQVQGGSTITQQFVKNALAAQDRRTVFEKLREAALAYHLAHRWSKSKILGEYLNTIYFGNGAYGVESAARTYFGNQPEHAGCGASVQAPSCASELKPYEAALLAGMVASPTAFNPVTHYAAAMRRRNLVLRLMAQQGMLTRPELRYNLGQPLPAPSQVHPPEEAAPTPATPYFTTWVRQQVVDRYGAQLAYEGGLRVKTTLDLSLQRAAEQAIHNHLWAGGPSAAMVAIDNQSGQVRAMVGGSDYNDSPFNLATEGQRQPGSSIKPFILARALWDGISPESVWPSEQRVFHVPHSHELFVVHNDEDSYLGSTTLAHAIAESDNSVFAAVGIHVGVSRVARLAERMGIRTPISHNYAMTLGGLKEGVTPLDMAHAYETLARGGLRVTGTLGSADEGPVGIREIDGPNGKVLAKEHSHDIRVLPANVAHEAASLMTAVVTEGTGRAAAVPGMVIAGKTGTTSNYGDAWFVGFSQKLTVAVWVGYPTKLKSMSTEYHGGPVMGGTFPAEIFRDFMMSYQNIEQQRAAVAAAKNGHPAPLPSTQTIPGVPAAPPPVPTSTAPSTPATVPSTPSSPTPSPTPSTGGTGGGSTGTGTTTPSTSSPSTGTGTTSPSTGTGTSPSGGGGTSSPSSGGSTGASTGTAPAG